MLNLSDRDMLIARMQAYAYSNVLSRDYGHAEQFAIDALALFDGLVESHPTDSMGFWANRAFERFEHACAALA